MMENAAMVKGEKGPAVSLTERAAQRIAAMTSQNSESMLRLAVYGGGCSGFRYDFSLESRVHEDDCQFESYGVTLLVDEASLELLHGAEIDYVEDLIGASFQVKNPNASSSCGCGSSFATRDGM